MVGKKMQCLLLSTGNDFQALGGFIASIAVALDEMALNGL